ncbi:MAG: ribbon-helix-helix domain-containing protein [Pseudomonadales bacterium]|jgi:metal-responsive CopG/Arc/MetJ family transcriptional regulator|nr:ribbon-helix-helix domain-containing protein [Pseudomonadales bacterium]
MNRILVDLPDAQIDALTTISELERRPRAAVIRDAIATYIVQHRQASEGEVFGLWKKKKIDGLAYQQELRSQW